MFTFGFFISIYILGKVNYKMAHYKFLYFFMVTLLGLRRAILKSKFQFEIANLSQDTVILSTGEDSVFKIKL